MTAGKELKSSLLRPEDTARSGAFPSSCQQVLISVGLDFLVEGTAAFICDSNGIVQWANNLWITFIEGLGYGADLGQLPWSYEDIVATARIRPDETICHRHELATLGGTVTISSRHWVALASDGALIGIAGTIDDAPLIDRLRRQSAAFRERLEDLTKLISDFLWETGPDLKLNYVSDRAIAMIGLHPRQLTGKKLTELGRYTNQLDGIAPDPLTENPQRPFENQSFTMNGDDGTLRHFRLSGLPMFDTRTGQFRGYRGTARDVTVETTALGIVRSSRRQLSQAIEAISDGFALFDADERLQMCNQYFVGMFPKAGKLFYIGMRYAELIDSAVQAGDLREDPERRSEISRSLTAQLAKPDGIEYEIGDGRWIRATDRLTIDGTIVDIRTDITELIHREHALMEATRVAEEASRSKSEFLANISHELRTPLNAIIGFSELMLHESAGPIGNPTYKDYLGDVLNSGQHLLDIINDIIDLSNAEAGRLELHEESTEIERAVLAISRVMQERALRSKLTLTTYVAPGLHTIVADQRKLRQILLALVSNAVKFTRPGGSVMLDVSRDPVTGELVFRVSDTGIGIAPEDMEKVLRPFGQVDGSLNRRYEGVGLGLPLARALTLLHHGTIELESELGIGTTVIIRFPASRVIG